FRARVRRRHLECDDRGRPPRRGRGLFHRRRGRPLRPDADRALASRVDASRIVVNGGAHTGLYFVTHGPDGHSFSYLRAGSAASRIAETDLPVDRIRETKILHVSGISQAISSSAADAVFAAIDIAHGANRLVSYDPNLRLKLWPLRRARAHRGAPGRGGRRHRGGRLFRRRLPRRIRPRRRPLRRRALRQCRRFAVDAWLWRRRAAAAPRRGRSGVGGGAMTPFFPSPSLAAGYLVACLMLAATPGADMALFLSRTLRGGRMQGFAAQAGANAGLIVHSVAAALGLSALLAASAEAYQAVKIAGALYLLWLA